MLIGDIFFSDLGEPLQYLSGTPCKPVDCRYSRSTVCVIIMCVTVGASLWEEMSSSSKFSFWSHPTKCTFEAALYTKNPTTESLNHDSSICTA